MFLQEVDCRVSHLREPHGSFSQKALGLVAFCPIFNTFRRDITAIDLLFTCLFRCAYTYDYDLTTTIRFIFQPTL